MANLFVHANGSRPRRRAFLPRFGRMVLRALIAAIILWLGLSVPLPFTPAKFFVYVQVPVVIFLFVIYSGKLLYDTFFYDRYVP